MRPQPLQRLLSRPKPASGVALVTVLWLVAILTLIATSTATISVQQRRAVANAAESAAIELLLDGAIRLMLQRSISDVPAGSALHLGVAENLAVLGQSVSVFVDNEAGRIDLNFAPEELLAKYLQSGGLEATQSVQLAARIVDWRDEDSDVGAAGGAERSDYQTQERAGPRNAAFESVGELSRVMGAEQLDSAMLDGFTVYSRLLEPQWNEAPTLVRNAQPPVQAAPDALEVDQPAESESTVADTQRAIAAGDILRFKACTIASRWPRCRIAIARLTGNSVRPWLIYRWDTIPEASTVLVR